MKARCRTWPSVKPTPTLADSGPLVTYVGYHGQTAHPVVLPNHNSL